MNSFPIRREQSAHRRGLVLGLSMAETIILVIFCLLLLTSSLFSKAIEREAQLVKENRVANERGDAAEQALIELGKSPDTQRAIADDYRELVLLRAEVPELRRATAMLVEARAQISDLQKDLAVQRSSVLKNVQELATLRAAADTRHADTLLVSQLEDQIKDLKDKIASIEIGATGYSRLTEHLVQAFHAAKLPEPVEGEVEKLAEKVAMTLTHTSNDISPAQLTKDLMLARADAQNLREQLASYRRIAAGEGKGTERPACWANEATGKPVYLFDVELSEQGLTILDRIPADRADQAKELPLHDVRFDEPISEDDFLRQTRDLFSWGVVHDDCRFFVRAFDRTGPAEKTMFKSRMRTLERHFYKLLAE